MNKNSSSTPEAMSTLRAWLAIVMLGIGAFIIVTTELLPIGVLPLIAGDLNETTSKIGLTVTGYAWVGAISAVLFTAAITRFERKRLFVSLMVVLAVANYLSSMAESFNMLMAARILAAVSHGMFWSIIGALAAKIAPPGQIGRATSIVFTGVSVASVLGVPLGTFVGQQFGWQSSFSSIALLCCLVIVAGFILLPKIENESPAGMKGVSSILKRKDLWVAYIVAAFTVTGHFSMFTYLVPYLEGVAQVSSNKVVVLLFIFGAAGMVGNFLTAIYADHHFRTTLLMALLATALSIMALALSSTNFWLVCLILCIWGASISAQFVVMQTWIIKLAPQSTEIASSFYVGIFNVAIGLGAFFGSIILTHFDLQSIVVFGAGLSFVAFLLVASLYQYANGFESKPHPQISAL